MVFIYDTLRKKVVFLSLHILFYAVNNYSCLFIDSIQRPVLNSPNKDKNLQLKANCVNLDLKESCQTTL